jgi:hypothetical protein
MNYKKRTRTSKRKLWKRKTKFNFYYLHCHKKLNSACSPRNIKILAKTSHMPGGYNPRGGNKSGLPDFSLYKIPKQEKIFQISTNNTKCP